MKRRGFLKALGFAPAAVAVAKLPDGPLVAEWEPEEDYPFTDGPEADVRSDIYGDDILIVSTVDQLRGLRPGLGTLVYEDRSQRLFVYDGFNWVALEGSDV